MNKLQFFIEQGNESEFDRLLSGNPELANIDIIWGPKGKNQTHPLHYLCDCVFENKIDEDTAIRLAEVLFQHGAKVDGKALVKGKDSPMIGACSLNTDKLALLFLSKNPNLQHKGVHYGTCLHWACWTGATTVVKALLQKEINLDDRENEFNNSPLEWAVHAYTNGPAKNRRDQISVIQLLKTAGADTSGVKIDPEKHPELAQILNK